MSGQDKAALPAWLGWARLAIGLAQGLALFWLHRADDLGYWPATFPELFGAGVLVAVFAPLIAIGGLGAVRPLTLLAWLALAGGLLAWLGWHDLASGVRPSYRQDSWPDASTYMAAATIMFIAHHLIAAAAEARKWIAPYERYFDLGWRHAAQLVLSCAFTGAFWVLLYLGAALFKIINITFLEELIRKDWFYFPATSTAFAAAIHLTDLRAGLVRGFRALSLMLLSWLMPVLTLLGAAFLLALPFTGLDPLWQTRAAGAILLSAAANLIILINAAYQDGAADTSQSRVLRLGARVAAVLLGPFIVLAGIALYLRVDQHGWSPERIQAGALIVIGACYALFYLVAAFWRPWIKLIEGANVFTACVVIAVLVALFTPIFDPTRISVANQLERLRAGAMSPAEFDYIFLQFDSGRYGRDAAARLVADRSTSQAREISGRMTAVAAYSSRWEAEDAIRPRGRDDESPRVADVRPPLRFALLQGSAPLPASFEAEAENLYGGPMWRCRHGRAACEARTIDFDDDAAYEVLVVSGVRVAVFDERVETPQPLPVDPAPDGGVEAQTDGQIGTWRLVAQGTLCGVQRREDLRAGRVTTAPERYRRLIVGGESVDLRRERPARCVDY